MPWPLGIDLVAQVYSEGGEGGMCPLLTLLQLKNKTCTRATHEGKWTNKRPPLMRCVATSRGETRRNEQTFESNRTLNGQHGVLLRVQVLLFLVVDGGMQGMAAT